MGEEVEVRFGGERFQVQLQLREEVGGLGGDSEKREGECAVGGL